jgi:glycosyltransferase involved in cell wall biosynthesis
VAVLGAVGPDKGARRLEHLAELVRANGARLRFVLIGYMDVEHGPWQSDDAVLTIHGRYEPRDLPALLAHYRARIVAFPSAGPETFSFTLSEAWEAGLPVVVPPFGALGERVADAGAGWLWTDDEWSDEAKMLARLAAILAPANAASVAEMADRARAVALSAPETMVESTLQIYGAAIDASRRAQTMGRARVPSSPAVSSASSSMRTNVRRVLDRLTPARLRKLLKARPR